MSQWCHIITGIHWIHFTSSSFCNICYRNGFRARTLSTLGGQALHRSLSCTPGSTFHILRLAHPSHIDVAHGKTMTNMLIYIRCMKQWICISCSHLSLSSTNQQGSHPENISNSAGIVSWSAKSSQVFFQSNFSVSLTSAPQCQEPFFTDIKWSRDLNDPWNPWPKASNILSVQFFDVCLLFSGC